MTEVEVVEAQLATAQLIGELVKITSMNHVARLTGTSRENIVDPRAPGWRAASAQEDSTLQLGWSIVRRLQDQGIAPPVIRRWLLAGATPPAELVRQEQADLLMLLVEQAIPSLQTETAQLGAVRMA